MRTININKEIWKYKIGETYINIFSPSGKRFNCTISEVTGEGWSMIERGKWKKWWKGVSPRQIREYIVKILLN